ncbi:MAG: hypothetical protein WBZ36_27885, partial [Candidatus Nitrosopolaris sp.]
VELVPGSRLITFKELTIHNYDTFFRFLASTFVSLLFKANTMCPKHCYNSDKCGFLRFIYIKC